LGHDAFVSPAHVVQNLSQLTTGQGRAGCERTLAVHAANQSQIVRPADRLFASVDNLLFRVSTGQQQNASHFLPIGINPCMDCVSVGQFIDRVDVVDGSAGSEVGTPTVVNASLHTANSAIRGNTDNQIAAVLGQLGLVIG